ncbi:MAG: nickel pincer cofactor biosynthesis protein LarB [Dehalococcoidia bacterium]|nr:nickel pincer cofactor biosynthesis protein LarB [Dehalococcoidia bacterium]
MQKYNDRLLKVLESLKAGDASIEETMEQLRNFPYEDIGYAKIDHHRVLRKGMPEVVFGMGKTPEQVAAIAERLSARADLFLVTRVTLEHYTAVQECVPDAVFNPVARTITVDRTDRGEPRPGIMVLCAGTSDIPVAEEAVVTAETMGNKVERAYDVGIAGLHRLLDLLPDLREANVVVVVAGMEGALPSVVGGLIAAPVIAVPTSVGYGASFGGLAALLAMLNSCASGVSVVNIDNGFGAGYLASAINGLATLQPLLAGDAGNVSNITSRARSS